MQRMWLLIFNLWHKKIKNFKNFKKGYKTIHTSTKRIEDKKNDNNNNNNNNFQIIYFNVSHMELVYWEWKTKKYSTSPVYW